MVNSCKAQEANHSRLGKQLKHGLQKAQDKVEKLEGELSDATPDAAAIEVLEEQLKTAQKEQKRCEDIFEDVVAKKLELGDENAVNMRALQAAQREVQDLEFRLAKAQARVRTMQDQREDALKAKNKLLESIKMVEDNKKLWVAEQVNKQAEVDETTARALRACRCVRL